MDSDTKYVAIAYGSDCFAGKSSFAPMDEFAIRPVCLKASFTQLMSMWRTTMMRDEESIPPEHLDQPIGFWILTEENLKTALLLWGSDSAGGNNRGVTNEFTKRLCHHLASGIVGSSIERAEKLCSMDKLHLVANILKLENHLSG